MMTQQAVKWPYYTPPAVVAVRGLPTGYRRKGTGPVVVYLGGLYLCGKWLPFHQALAGRTDLIVPELPGFGETALPDWLRSVDDAVLHLDDLLAELGVGDFHLTGQGLGGWVAARFAVIYPRRLRSLTLISAMGLRVQGSPLYDYFRMTPDEADDILLNGTSGKYQQELDNGDYVEATVRTYKEITAAARMAWNPRYDVRFDRLLQRVTAPALVIAPQQDRVVPRSHAERYAQLLPNATLRVIEGSDAPTAHLALLQEPARLAEAIASFAARQEA